MKHCERSLATALTLFALAGCAQQAPAPVVSGYGNSQPTAHYTLQAARQPGEGAYDVEPAAGPVSSAATTAPSMKEEQLASIAPSTAAKATLPPPSIIGDAQLAPSTAKGWRQYTVQKGDTIYRLAREFDTNPDAIIEANKLGGASDISTGQTLMVPAGIGRFGKLESVASLEKPAAPAVVEQPATLAEAKPAAEVVTGPNGTRYKLTEEVAANAKAEPKVEDVEPAAGPVDRVTQPQNTVSVLEHRVEPGETVYRIAQKYGASVIDIMNANEFNAPQDLKSGTVVKVPVASGKNAMAASNAPLKVVEEGERVASLNTKTMTDTATTEVQAALHKGKIDPVASKAKGMIWPVKGSVMNGFGVEGQGVAHTGIAIKVPANTPVLASEGGTVVYADNALKTYGNLVLLRHDNGMVTAYGHNNALLVVKGEKVKKGQTIALSGNSGNVKEPQLHFEVRQNARAIDPVAVLPKR